MGDEGINSCWSIKPWMTSGSSNRLGEGRDEDLEVFALLGATSSESGPLRLPFGGTFAAMKLSSWETAGDGSLFATRDTVRALAFVFVTLGSLPILASCCGRAWHNSFPRFTPVESRSDLALRAGGGEGSEGGGGGGEGSFGGTLTGCSANSILLRRFEALTGGEEGGAGRFGVSRARTLGTGTLPLGIFGVFAGACGGTTGRGAGVLAVRSILFLTTLGGVLGSVTSER